MKALELQALQRTHVSSHKLAFDSTSTPDFFMSFNNSFVRRKTNLQLSTLIFQSIVIFLPFAILLRTPTHIWQKLVDCTRYSLYSKNKFWHELRTNAKRVFHIWRVIQGVPSSLHYQAIHRALRIWPCQNIAPTKGRRLDTFLFGQAVEAMGPHFVSWVQTNLSQPLRQPQPHLPNILLPFGSLASRAQRDKQSTEHFIRSTSREDWDAWPTKDSQNCMPCGIYAENIVGRRQMGSIRHDEL